MLVPELVKVFDASDVFTVVNRLYGEDVEGQFNEIYCPPCDGAVPFFIPNSNEEWDECAVYEKYIAYVLMKEGGLTWGDSCYLRFDY